MSAQIWLSHTQAKALLRGQQQGLGQVRLSPDLGRTQVRVTLSPQGAHFPGGVILSWAEAQRIADHPNAVFMGTDDRWQPVRAFSALTQRVVALYPTSYAPSVLISGIPMHRVQGSDPWRDTRAKVQALRPRGRVLDTCFGLGYSALQAATTAEWVLSVELDPAVLTVARRNPWSRPVFEHSRVRVVQADVARLVAGLPANFFSAILHDPPQFALAGELYGAAFYAQLWRILKPSGRLFHYVGNQETKMGRNITRGVMERLREVGFDRVKPVPRAFGVLAVKPR